ncbi:hypothetical protein BZA05DRAFT_217722 [Tricharina praecox]|uniref:uncharacterized protein n=1 Tax=Tricharina praecox TaxID=43433 RepID=UPI00221FE613|nr:uncharacterized protein BZA05DRAFT_217722 [Tricharina praecox]KAI5855787.1 hypothetical protein BZA05DRAFT_217722 [Tricharina praecox]
MDMIWLRVSFVFSCFYLIAIWGHLLCVCLVSSVQPLPGGGFFVPLLRRSCSAYCFWFHDGFMIYLLVLMTVYVTLRYCFTGVFGYILEK